MLKCKAGSQVVLGGSGTLTVTSLGKHGISSGSATDEQDASLTVRALTLQITTELGDALHAEQTLTIESGNLTLTATDDALHSDGAITITGGTVLVAGGSGSMGMQLTTEQPYLLQQSGAAIVAGETLSIADADGTNILDACQAPCTVSFLFYTSPDLTDGQSYTLQGSGSASARLEAQIGALQGGMMPGGPAGGPGADGEPRHTAPPAGKAARLPHLRMVHRASQVLKLPSKSAALCRPWPAAQCFFRFPAMDSCICQMDMLHCILHYFRGEKKWTNNRKREVHFPASSVLYWRQRAHRSGWAIYGDSRISRQSMVAGSFCSFILSWR